MALRILHADQRRLLKSLWQRSFQSGQGQIQTNDLEVMIRPYTSMKIISAFPLRFGDFSLSAKFQLVCQRNDSLEKRCQ